MTRRPETVLFRVSQIEVVGQHASLGRQRQLEATELEALAIKVAVETVESFILTLLTGIGSDETLAG